MQWRRGSDTRIVLVKPRERVVVPRKPCVPTLAGGLRGGQAADRGHDVALPLEDLHGETGGRVPGDMTMQKPHSWIIGPERNSQITSRRQKRDVPSWGILKFEGTDAGVDIVWFCALGKNDKVVAVKMHRVSDWSRNLGGVIALSGNDEVDKALREVLGNDSVVCFECGVVEVQNGRV